MNTCVNHPDAAVTAYCQNCGKGLCSACTRTVNGNIYCEPCQTARTAQTAAPGAGPVGPGPIGAGPIPPGYPPPPPPASGPNPGTAAVLGFIPGVGAMYNGQYIKAIVHVLVFVVLVGMAGRFWFFGLLIAFWVLYQVFDALQTAKARRDGLPLPDPFGLNELGNRIGGQAATVPPMPPGSVPPGTMPPPPGAVPGSQPYVEWAEQVRQQAHQWGEYAGQMGENIRARVVNEATQAGTRWAAPPPPPPGSWAAPPPPPGWQAGPVPPVPPIELERARREPIGAIVLILLGMLFLFNTLGFFSFGWVHHGWPLIIIGIAVWLLVRNSSWGHRMHFRHAQVAPQDADKQTGGGQ